MSAGSAAGSVGAARVAPPSLEALGAALRRAPVAPTSLVDRFTRHEAALEFRRIVREVFPDGEAEILAAREPGGDRESARVWAFLRRIEAEFFPVYECDDYDQVLGGAPFARNAWAYDRFHELDLPLGELLLFALCAQPYEPGEDSRLALLDAVAARVPEAAVALAELPRGGLTPADLHARLDGTRYAAAAEYADWLWGQTDSVFLDVDEEVVLDVEWTRDNVLELARQWRRAEGLLDRVTELAGWLEGDPAGRFARLLEAALGRDAHLEYQRMRRWYAYEITDQGLVPVPRDGRPGADDPDDPDGVAGPRPQEAGPVPLPPGAAG